MSKLTIYDAEYWANRYLETYSNPRARERLAAEVGAEWGDSVLIKTMEHWKKLADQLTRPACGDKCTSHPCPCGHPERHCLGCSGESVNGKPADSKPATPGSSPGSPATHRERLIRHVTALLGWRDEVKFISVHYKSGAVATCNDGMFSSYMPANFKPRIVRVESTHEAHQIAASFDACPECNPKQKCDHLPEGSH